MAKIIKIMVMLLVPLGFITTVGVTAQAKTQSTPKPIRGTWVNGIQYKYKGSTKKVKFFVYERITNHAIIGGGFQSDEYYEKIVSIKKMKNVYRLKVQDFSYLPLKHHTYHYIYAKQFTVNKKRYLILSSSYSKLGTLDTLYGTAKDNGLGKYF